MAARGDARKPAQDLDRLQDAIGHMFADTERLTRALSHRSVAPSGKARALETNERLEFLGDRVLGLVIADMLVSAFPTEPEGKLAPRLTALVRAETLAEVARELGLGTHLILSEGEDSSGSRDNASILADACEAVIGALYVDGGLGCARKFIQAYWTPYMKQEKTPPKDAKTGLQEWAQGRGLPLPKYTVSKRSGPDHAPDFTVTVSVLKHGEADGNGSSKRLAEQQAATNLLERLTGGEKKT